MEVNTSDNAGSSDIRCLPALPISSRLISTTKPIVPVLPNLTDLPLNAQLVMDHYTRLQILNKTNEFYLSDISWILSEMRENRISEDIIDVVYKVLIISEFLAISFVRQSSIDVVAVSIDRVSIEMIKVIIAYNESTSDDVNQANTLRKLFVDYFINNRSEKGDFKQEYLRIILSWGSLRYERRLMVLNHPESTQQDPKSAAHASKLLTIEKIMSRFTKISKNNDKLQQVKFIHNRYTTLHNTIMTSTPGTTAILRGDIFLLKQAKRTKLSLLSMANSCLVSIKSSIDYSKGTTDIASSNSNRRTEATDLK